MEHANVPDDMRIRLLHSISPALYCNNSTVVKSTTIGIQRPTTTTTTTTVDIESQISESGILLSDMVREEPNNNNNNNNNGQYHIEGSSTDSCILEFALHLLGNDGMKLIKLQKFAPRMGEFPFDSRHKFMATIHEMDIAFAQRILPNAQIDQSTGKII